VAGDDEAAHRSAVNCKRFGVGEQLLQRARPYGGVMPSFGIRLLRSGLLQILAGAWGTLALISLLENLLGITLLMG
jgi:hypothetical protein